MHHLLRRMQPVSLEVREGDQAGTYPTLILDYSEDADIVVGVPLEQGREVHLASGTPLRLVFTRPDGLYLLPTTVLDRNEAQPSVRLAWPRRSERLQRREHPRVEVALPCTLALRSKVEAGERPLRARLDNLSAGGARVLLRERLEPAVQVRLSLEIPDAGELVSEARVLRAGEHPEGGSEAPFWAALEFVGMLESARNVVGGYVMQVQREQLRRGAA
jgi:c-di-GMP-binding flagellar brake protein YcgR